MRLAHQQPLRCSERPRKNDIENERAAQRIPSPSCMTVHPCVCPHPLHQGKTLLKMWICMVYAFREKVAKAKIFGNYKRQSFSTFVSRKIR